MQISNWNKSLWANFNDESQEKFVDWNRFEKRFSKTNPRFLLISLANDYIHSPRICGKLTEIWRCKKLLIKIIKRFVKQTTDYVYQCFLSFSFWYFFQYNDCKYSIRTNWNNPSSTSSTFILQLVAFFSNYCFAHQSYRDVDFYNSLV